MVGEIIFISLTDRDLQTETHSVCLYSNVSDVFIDTGEKLAVVGRCVSC